jgi:hypothetical protein
MNFLRMLFRSRTRHHHYALLDNSGICVAFRHCATRPEGSGWVEINDVCLSWLNKPLPERARIHRDDGHPHGHAPVTN